MFTDDDLLIKPRIENAFASRVAELVRQRSLELLGNQFCSSGFIQVLLYDGQGNRIDFYRGGEIVGSIVGLAKPQSVATS